VSEDDPQGEETRRPGPGGATGQASPDAGEAFQALADVVARLRAPDGCPWDRDQTHESLTPYVIEEAHEVVEAIQSGRPAALRDELGDLLLQVVLHAQVARDGGGFSIADVCEHLSAKLVRRHPHVFGEAPVASSAADVRDRWETYKDAERRSRGEVRGVLDGVPRSLPALLKAQRLSEKAGGVGFDWPDAAAVLGKLREELGELETAVQAGDRREASREFGDLLFVLANLARHLGVDAEAALQETNGKFVRRFEHVERRLREQGRTPADASLDEMDALWNEAKREEPG